MFGFTFGNTIEEGVLTDGRHTYDDFGLKMYKASIPMPQPKENKVDVPYRNGDIDLTDIYGQVYYKDRQNIEFKFKLEDKNYEEWELAKSAIANALHGKKWKVVLDSDPGFYYVMRLSVAADKSNKQSSEITLTGSAEPYKYSVISSNEPWLWDTFSFVDGVITTVDVLHVNGTATVRIAPGFMLTTPTINCADIQSTPFTVTDGVNTVNLVSGDNYDPRIKVGGGNIVTLTFTGKATVTLIYRGGSL